MWISPLSTDYLAPASIIALFYCSKSFLLLGLAFGGFPW
jgi:hypothetical protein